MTAIYAVTFVMSAVLIYKWTLSYYDDDDNDDDDDDDDTHKIVSFQHYFQLGWSSKIIILGFVIAEPLTGF